MMTPRQYIQLAVPQSGKGCGLIRDDMHNYFVCVLLEN